MIERKKQMGRDKISRLVNWGHWFAFFNGILAMIIGNRYISSIGYPDSLLGWGYLTINTIGQFSFLSFIIYLIFLFPISTIFPYSKILRGYAALIGTSCLCILLYDSIVFDDYGMHLSPFAFDLAWSDLNALLHGTSYIVTPIAILIIELTAANFIWKRIEKIQKHNWGPKIVIAVCFCFISSHLIHIWADAREINAITRFDDTYPLSYPATAKTFMESHGLDNYRIHNNRDKQTATLHYPKQPLQCTAQSHPNVLLITIDNFRADMANHKTMPFFANYANQNQHFTDHYSGGNQFGSGMFSLLYGLQGSYMDAVDFNYKAPLLSQIFKKEGYHLGLFINKSELNGRYPEALFNDFTIFSKFSPRNSADADLALIDQFAQWRTVKNQPWFAVLNIRSPETYDTPVGFLGIETISSPAHLQAAQRVLFHQYRQSLNFVDHLLSKVISPLPEDTLIMITGLNGKVFTSNENEARNNLSPENVKVPMVIHWPSHHHSQVQYTTSHYGVAPTLMSQILGCKNALTDYSSGRHLLQPDEQNWHYIGDNKMFAIYQKNEITVINRHGQYFIYDKNYQHQLKKKVSAPELINVMQESRRFYK